VFSGTPTEIPKSTTTRPAPLEVEERLKRSETVVPKQVSIETENPTSTKERGTEEDKQPSLERMGQPKNMSTMVSIKEDTASKAIVQKPISLPSTDTSKLTKKTLYITKQDTIFKYDTVRTHKSRKKWLK
jgi:hypothetical protein